jgi:hypothetical protein
MPVPREAALSGQPPRKQCSLLLRRGEDRVSVTSTRTVMVGQAGGRTDRPGAVPATSSVGSSLGSRTQSTTYLEKWLLVSGHASCYHGADSHKRISIVVNPFCFRSVLHTFPIKL